MPLKLISQDLTKVKADVIVNSANPDPVFKRGTDRAIYQEAGADALLAIRQQIGKLQVGEVAVTTGFQLPCRYVFHVVAPIWQDGKHQEAKILAGCYQRALQLAVDLGCQRIAFPLLATGTNGYPKDEAFKIAVKTIRHFLLQHELTVFLVLYDQESYQLFQALDTYLQAGSVVSYRMSLAAMPIEEPGETFQACLFRLIDERGLSDAMVYKKANLDRKLFSKIRCHPDYHPKKKTILALAIALELDIAETEDLLSRAELALSPSNQADLIIRYFITEGIYDIDEINLALFQYHQPLLE